MSSSTPSPSNGESRPRAPPMYWCHECGIEMRPLMTPDPTCPRCNGGFVEEIDPSNPIAEEDTDEEDQQMLDVPRPFAGAAGPSIGVHTGNFAAEPLDLGTFMGGIIRNLASAGSQPRPAGYTPTPPPHTNGTERSSQGEGSSNNSNSQFRTGTSQVGPLNFSWGVGSYQTHRAGGSGAVPTVNNPNSTSESPFAGGGPMRLNEFLRQSFENDGHEHDDGMGGAGGAADGRFFNRDNQTPSQRTGQGDEQNDEDEGDSNAYPPELASIRNAFANLFGGLGDGPASMLIDLFGGGMGRGRTGDYVWGQQGLDDVITQLMEQTRGSTAPPPASEEAINRLDRFSRKDLTKVRQARNRECSTCMDSFEEEDETQSTTHEPSLDSNRLSSTLMSPDSPKKEEDDPPETLPQEEQQDELMMMPCKHLFHLDCLLPWLKTNGTCPVCRVSLEPEKDKNKSDTGRDGSNQHGEASSSTLPPPSQNDEDEDDSPDVIRERSRRAAEARLAGTTTASNEPTQTVPGSFLQPDELD